MPDSVATRVAERLAIQPQQSERVLRALARLIKSQSARDGRVRVPGLGIFAHSDEGIAFEPDRRLAEAVNVRYAGLEPVPIEDTAAPLPEALSSRVPIPPAEEPTPAAEEQPASVEAPAPEQEASAEPLPIDPPPLDASEPQEEQPAEEEAQESTAAEQELEPVAPVPSDVKDSESAAREAVVEEEAPREDESSDEADALAEPVIEPQPPAVHQVDVAPRPPTPSAEPSDMPPRPPRRPVAHDVSQQRSTWPWIALVVIVLLGAFGAYYWFNLRTPPSPIATNDTETAPPSEAITPPTEATPENASEQDEQPTQEDEPTADTEPQPSELSTTEPLALAPEEGGYTWIVGSHTSRADADAQLARYRERLSGQLVRIGVLTGTSSGVTRYRVGVGQVPTKEEATALRERLGDMLPGDAWLRNVEADT